MAIFVCQIKHVSKGKSGGGAMHAKYLGKDHVGYLSREGPAKGRADLELCLSGNMPKFANGNPKVFWASADKYERANGRIYTEFVVAFPRELNRAEREALLRDFVAKTIGDRFPYTAAIHNPKALDGGDQPHAHIMFNTRVRDDIERTAEKYFSRYNPAHPEKGGARKADEWRQLDPKAKQIELVRGLWERSANSALEKANRKERVDRRSLNDRGVERAPEPKMGPAATQRVKQGRESELGARVKALREERAAKIEIDALKKEAIEIEEELRRIKENERQSATQSREPWEEDVSQREANWKGESRRIVGEYEYQPNDSNERPVYRKTLELVFTAMEGSQGTEYRWSRSGRQAFFDHGDRIEHAAGAHPTALKASIQLMKEKGWTEILITGDEVFKREMFIAATVAGLRVQGYRATERDFDRIAEQQVRQGAAKDLAEQKRKSRAKAVFAKGELSFEQYLKEARRRLDVSKHNKQVVEAEVEELKKRAGFKSKEALKEAAEREFLGKRRCAQFDRDVESVKGQHQDISTKYQNGKSEKGLLWSMGKEAKGMRQQLGVLEARWKELQAVGKEFDNDLQSRVGQLAIQKIVEAKEKEQKQAEAAYLLGQKRLARWRDPEDQYNLNKEDLLYLKNRGSTVKVKVMHDGRTGRLSITNIKELGEELGFQQNREKQERLDKTLTRGEGKAKGQSQKRGRGHGDDGPGIGF